MEQQRYFKRKRKTYNVQTQANSNGNRNNHHDKRHVPVTIQDDCDDEFLNVSSDLPWSPFPMNSTPLEMAPVIRNVLDYGRRTHALGLSRGIQALERLEDSLKGMRTSDAVFEVLDKVQDELAELRKLATPPTE